MSAVGLLILAAGGSRRMGRPKQLLCDAQGRSLIRRAAETAVASVCRPVVVVLGAAADAVRGELIGLPLTVAFNPEWQSGMASSLRTGLRVLATGDDVDAVALMLCDQPLVTPALLDALATAYHASGHHIVASEYDGTSGAPALFSREMFPALNGLNGDQGARRVIRAYPGAITRIAFPGGRSDVDTLADFKGIFP